MHPFTYIKTIKCSVNERAHQLMQVEEIIKSERFHFIIPNEIIDKGRDSSTDIFKNHQGNGG